MRTIAEVLGPDLPGVAACRDAAPAFDFLIAGEKPAARAHRHERAVQVCTGCAVLEDCRRALDSEHQPAGVWAGIVVDPGAPVRARAAG